MDIKSTAPPTEKDKAHIDSTTPPANQGTNPEAGKDKKKV